MLYWSVLQKDGSHLILAVSVIPSVERLCRGHAEVGTLLAITLSLVYRIFHRAHLRRRSAVGLMLTFDAFGSQSVLMATVAQQANVTDITQ